MKVIGYRSQIKSSQTGWFVPVARVKSFNVCRNNKLNQSRRQSDLKVAKNSRFKSHREYIAMVAMTSGLSPEEPHERVDQTPKILCRFNENMMLWLLIGSNPTWVHEYYFHHSINIKETWESKIRMIGLEKKRLSKLLYYKANHEKMYDANM